MESTKRLKFVLIGDKHVGKRNLLALGFNKPRRASPLYIPIEFNDVELKYKNRVYQISCYDSLVSSSNTGSNQNRIIDSLNAEAILNADALLLCYAGDNASSFQALAKLYREFKYQNAPAYLVETKKDNDFRSSESFNPSSLPINIVQTFRFPSVNKENIVNMFQTIIDDIEERPYNPNQYSGQAANFGYAQETQSYRPTEQVIVNQNQHQQQQQQQQQPTYTQYAQGSNDQYRQPETPLNQNQQFEQARISQTESYIVPQSNVQQTPVRESFASPDEKHSTKKEIRYSDKKEKIILMDGSYAKRLTVVDESKNVMERSTRVVQKNVKDAIVEKPDDY